MKKCFRIVLSLLLILPCALLAPQKARAFVKANETRAIAIVFDNSGSMYEAGNQAWCRATYAMEVFASMLNAGDILQIYPMWPITAGGQTYAMNTPLQITDAAQASSIRDIFTEDASGTPIESIDCAAAGLQSIQADKKYMIVLTDGGTFSKNGYGLSRDRTRKELDRRVEQYAGAEMTVMYLGIGSAACMPNAAESETFIKRHAVNTADVLSTLTVMCNQIFGRDTLPKSCISGNTIEFDISMSKLILFVQGENIADLKLTGSSAGKLIGTQQTKYSSKGAGDYKSVPDTSLQGMMVTYADCGAGKYDIEYTGTATSVEVYYEPDADLDFVFTDAEGKKVDPNALYEGNYKVSFGMKDAKTGELISSDLLGKPKYQGHYSIDGQEFPISHEGFSGSVEVPLKMGEKFSANLTATYLSGYTISKDSTDFGWPEGGIQVASRPAGNLRLEISGGDDIYFLQDLGKGAPYIAKLYYQDLPLTGSELEKAELSWPLEGSSALIRPEFAEDHWKLWLDYQDSAAPQDTSCGECTVPIHAYYSAPGSNRAEAQCPLTYRIEDNLSPLELDLQIPESYLVIGSLEDSQEILVNLKQNGAPLPAEEFTSVQLAADCGGIEHSITSDPQNSRFRIRLLPTNGIKAGDYHLKISAQYTDHIGRTVPTDASAKITLGNSPLWARWILALFLLLLLLGIIRMICRIRVLPSYVHTNRRASSMIFDGDDVTQSTNFMAEIKSKTAKIQAQFAGRKFGVSMGVEPGEASYLVTRQKARSARVKVQTVKKTGSAKITEVVIGTAKYLLDEETGKLTPAFPGQKPFLLKNGMWVKYSGIIQDAGIEKDFHVNSQLIFTKK